MSKYDELAGNYQDLISTDPIKLCVQYPEALRLLENVSGKHILDVGCGDGTFSRILAKQGAFVHGIDESEAQICKAVDEEARHSFGITYQQTDIARFVSEPIFDSAVAILSLNYAKNRNTLTAFFQAIHHSLKKGGPLIVLTFNPHFQRLGKKVYLRRYSKIPHDKIQVEFFSQKSPGPLMTTTFSDLTMNDYILAAEGAGFEKLQQQELQIHANGPLKSTDPFWNGFIDDCPFVAFRVFSPTQEKHEN